MASGRVHLIHEYWVADVESDLLDSFIRENRRRVFGDPLELHLRTILSDEERSSRRTLEERLRDAYQLKLGIYCGQSLVGWSFGRQESDEAFCMSSTGVLPDHQRRGIYGALLPVVIDVARSAGFQLVQSRHLLTNSAVIIAKLKSGFVISGFEISELFGALVRLTYYCNRQRGHAFRVRVGAEKPDSGMRAALHIGRAGDVEVG